MPHWHCGAKIAAPNLTAKGVLEPRKLLIISHWIQFHMRIRRVVFYFG